METSTCFNFTDQLYWLVASDGVLFGKLDNFDVNDDDLPFSNYFPINGLLSTTNSGQWSNMAYSHEVKDPANDFLMPIIIACDETRLQKGSKKASSMPLLLTTSILNQKMRNLVVLHGIHLVTSMMFL
jgi:hypothetical protein